MCAEPDQLNGLSADEDDDSEDACDDVLGRSRAASAFYGVSWESFVEGGPHKLTYDMLHVFLVGADMGRFETNWFEVVRKAVSQECLQKCQNKGKGGERVRQGAVRFLYVCLKYIEPPTGGLQDDQVIEDYNGDDAKRRNLTSGSSGGNADADVRPVRADAEAHLCRSAYWSRQGRANSII